MYAVSYDDQKTLKEFSEKQGIPYPLLSDENSKVIGDYGILNTEVTPDDLMLYGIPFPGVYVCDEQGIVTAKFFHDTYKKRDSAETLLDAALGAINIDANAPSVAGGDDKIRITAAVAGGKGTVRQGIIRRLIVRFELSEGLHIYGEPVPEGLVATSVSISGPVGLVALEPEYPPTKKLHLDALDVDLQVWSGTVDIIVPFYPRGELASEVRPLDVDDIDIEVTVRYQVCTENECLLPNTETLTLNLGLDVVDMPGLAFHRGHGQRESDYDSTPSLRRLMWRKFKANPLGLFKFIIKNYRLERQAKARAKKPAQTNKEQP